MMIATLVLDTLLVMVRLIAFILIIICAVSISKMVKENHKLKERLTGIYNSYLKKSDNCDTAIDIPEDIVE